MDVMAPRLKTILILEDNLRVLAVLMDRLARLEERTGCTLLVVQFSCAKQAAEYSAVPGTTPFDIVFMDRNDKTGASFHSLDIGRLGPGRIIAISSVPAHNESLRKLGVMRIVDKQYGDLGSFADAVVRHVQDMIFFGDIA